MLRYKFRGNPFIGSGEEYFEGILPDDIWTWRPFWSCDLDVVSKLFLPLSKEIPHKI